MSGRILIGHEINPRFFFRDYGGMSIWAKWLPRVGFLTLAGACARLAFVLAVFAVLVAPFSFQRIGWPGIWAVVIAVGVCGVGGAMAVSASRQ